MTPDTQLRTLIRYDLRLECPACHHGATVRVSDLIKQLGGATTLGSFQARIRCRGCGMANPIVIINAAEEKGTWPPCPEEEYPAQDGPAPSFSRHRRRSRGHGPI